MSYTSEFVGIYIIVSIYLLFAQNAEPNGGTFEIASKTIPKYVVAEQLDKNF